MGHPTAGISRKEVVDRIIKLAEDFNRNEEGLAPYVEESSFVNDLNFDSLDLQEFVMDIEEEFHVNIAEADADGLLDIRSLADLVMKRLESA